MSGIRVVNTLEVETDIGRCFIDLCIGDITALAKRDEVDVLVVSAFPGDYIPTATSLIGQLFKKLGVSVKDLSKDKEEDLRSLYSCWWSKPLPKHLSFKKILCFESGGRRGFTVGQLVGDVFRCLVPILANKEGKVIMPILASGDQQASKTKMLRLLLNAAINWIQAGLPLRHLKIVIFSRDVKNISASDKPLLDLFQNIKNDHEERFHFFKEDETITYEHDVYLAYSEEDVEYVDHVVNKLEKRMKNIRLFSAVQELNIETSWQTQFYDVITKCKCVVTLITPGFLQSARCTEQYNIALCHSRKMQKNILMPLYITEVYYMPTYMKITQYIDCRRDFEENLSAACITVIESLSSNVVKKKNFIDSDKNISQKPSQQSYDVFLSYCHLNADYATSLVKELRREKPDINIFIDTAELKAGGAWQLVLYDALECSKFVITLISNEYLSSKVCMEEISIAIALQLRKSCKVFPILIGSLDKNASWLKFLSPKTFPQDFKEEDSPMAFLSRQFLVNFYDNEQTVTCKDIFQPTFFTSLEEARILFMDKKFEALVDGSLDFPLGKPEDNLDAPLRDNPDVPLEDNHDSPLEDNIPKLSTFTPKEGEDGIDVYVICSHEDEESFLVFQEFLSFKKSFVVKSSMIEDATSRLMYLEKARIIVPLLSSSFFQSSELIHELNIAWCRQRVGSKLCFVAITLGKLPQSMTYFHLFPCFFNAQDDCWTKDRDALELVKWEKLTRIYRNYQTQLNVLRCLSTAARCIQSWEDGEYCPFLGIHNKLFNYLQLRECIKRYKETLLNSVEVDHDKNTVDHSSYNIHQLYRRNNKSEMLSDKEEVRVETSVMENHRENDNRYTPKSVVLTSSLSEMNEKQPDTRGKDDEEKHSEEQMNIDVLSNDLKTVNDDDSNSKANSLSVNSKNHVKKSRSCNVV